MPPPRLIDAHHHLWAPDTDPAGVGWVWLRQVGPKPFGDPAPIRRDYLLDEFRAEPGRHRLDGSVHVQSESNLSDPVAETRFVQGLSDAAGFPIAIVGLVDLARPDARDGLTGHARSPGFRGVRQILSRDDARPERRYAPGHHLRDARWREGFALLSEMGLSFDLQLLPAQMLEAARFLEDHLDVPVVLDHLGCPDPDGDEGVWVEGLSALAALPQVRVKLSGYGMAFGSDLRGPAADATAEILSVFKPERTMFGSNVPVDKLWLNHDRIVCAALAACEGKAARDAIAYGTVASFYRLEPKAR